MQTLNPYLPIEEDIQVQGDLQLHEGKINLVFQWNDSKKTISLPEKIKLQRKNELWKQTCFEAFLQAEGASAYYEINLSASGSWNAYIFNDYRSPQPPMESDDISLLAFHRTVGRVEAQFAVHGNLERKLSATSWRCSLTAVIELKTENKYYFAVEHRGSRPDFHLKESFKLRRVLS